MKYIPLPHGLFTWVDDWEFEKLSQYSWHVSSKGYVRRNLNNGCRYGRTTVYMAKQIMEPPEGLQVDHINGDKLDNRRENLRIVNNALNCQNRSQKNNTSGYIGVVIHGLKFRAQIGFAGQRLYLGTFGLIEDAARAYDKKAIELFGPQAKTNFPV